METKHSLWDKLWPVWWPWTQLVVLKDPAGQIMWRFTVIPDMIQLTNSSLAGMYVVTV